MLYDIAGNQTQLNDPSAGIINYVYNGFGELTNQTNAKNQTTQLTYYSDGRPNQKILSVDGTTTYGYNTNKQLTSISSPGSISRTLGYDTKGRINYHKETIPGSSAFTTTFTYDSKGRDSTITHPSGIVEKNSYNANGYLSSISAGGIIRWTVTGMNARQQITAGTYGSNLNATFGYDNYGFPTSMVTGTIQNYQYNFDGSTGNLNWRGNSKYSGTVEYFQYDNLDRLYRVYFTSNTLQSIAYTPSKGGISTKSDVGTLNYNSTSKPYVLTSINPSTGLISAAMNDSLTYTSFEKVKTISEGTYTATFTYNTDYNRAKMIVLNGSSHVVTRWYPTNRFMKDSVVGTVKKYTYIGGGAYTAPVLAVTVNNGTPTYYYLLRDHLGSITHVVNTSNVVQAEYSYDAWGRMRNPTTWVAYAPGSEPVLTFAGRGFTGHEHLPWFKVINMNGRLYDPLVGQFLSPDNYIQAPGFTQSYNRYGYCLNNPLKYNDPSGNTWWSHFKNWINEKDPIFRAFIVIPTFLSVFPTELSTLDIATNGATSINFIRAGFDEAGQAIKNSVEIDVQLFDPGTEKAGWGSDLLSRFLLEGVNTFIGYEVSKFTNTFGNVNDVQFYRGVTVLQTASEWGAITFGNYIIGDKNIEASRYNPLFQHEFGHYLRSKKLGSLYLIEYGIPSLIDARNNSYEEHNYFWTELDANKMAFNYFNEEYPGFTGWVYQENPLFPKLDKRNNKYPLYYYGPRRR